jgi:hypothetical protein
VKNSQLAHPFADRSDIAQVTRLQSRQPRRDARPRLPIAQILEPLGKCRASANFEYM